MSRARIPTLTAADARIVDRLASERFGVPVEWLMEAAGWQVARACRRPAVVLAGTGNNGGDGLAAARHLHRWGRLVRVCCTDRSKLKDAAALEADALEAAGVRIEDDLVLDGAEAVVDALLGTGLSRPPNGRYAAWIDVVNASGLEVVSVDVPSGLESDSGEMLEPCVRASWTVTLGLPKPGLLTKSAKAMVGEIEVVDIGLPAPALSAVGIETRGIFVDSDRFTITDE